MWLANSAPSRMMLRCDALKVESGSIILPGDSALIRQSHVMAPAASMDVSIQMTERASGILSVWKQRYM